MPFPMEVLLLKNELKIACDHKQTKPKGWQKSFAQTKATGINREVIS